MTTGTSPLMGSSTVSDVGGASPKPAADRPTGHGTDRGVYVGAAAVPERKKLNSRGFLLQSTPYGPRPGYGAIGSMRGGVGVAGAEHRLRVRETIERDRGLQR